MSKSYKDLLKFTPLDVKKKTNIIEIWSEWDMNDADYISSTDIFNATDFFSNKQLILCLAYILWNGEDYDIRKEKEIDIREILNLHSDIIPNYKCYSLHKLKVTYYDENGAKFKVSFEDIIKRFDNTEYVEDIEDEINGVTNSEDE